MSEVPVEVRALAHCWGEWQQREPKTFPYTPDHCINGTRVAISVLARYGIKARPLSVQMALFNRFAWDLYHDGVLPKDWPAHAHSLGVGREAIGDGDGWDGHLVAVGDNWTLDLSAMQFNRPGRIKVEEPFVIPKVPPRLGWLRLTDQHRQVLMLARWPENDGWRSAPGWTKAPAPWVLDQIESRIEAAFDNQKGST